MGFGCTGTICKDQEGFAKPSNGVMGSIKHGRLIERCLNVLDIKLDEYYNAPLDKRKKFNYFELGKLIIWREYELLIKKIRPTKCATFHHTRTGRGMQKVDGLRRV